MDRPPLLLAVMGPTASGKTGLAEALSERLNAQLINSDAFQVYRGLDIGTAKPAKKHLYRLLDIRDPNEPFGVGEWVKLALPELERCFAEKQNVIVVGGTGLYVRALFEEYAEMRDEPDPGLREQLNATPIEDLRSRLLAEALEVASRTDMANPVRVRRALERLSTPPTGRVNLPPFQKLKLALDRSSELLTGDIERRIEQMVHNGFTQEIERLRQLGFHRDDPGFRAIGYRAFWDHLDQKMSLEEAISATIVETRRYAKRQRTWLRTEPDLVELSAATENDTIRKAMERIESILM